MRRWLWVVLLLGVAVLVGVAHSRHRQQPPISPASTNESVPASIGTPPVVVTPMATQAPTGLSASSTLSVPVSVPRTPTPTASSTASLTAQVWQLAATQFTQAYAHPPAARQASWAAGVQQWLAPSARMAFDGTNPLEVPFTKVTGRAVLHDAGVPSDVLALVEVPTDHGSWWVAMVHRPIGVRVPGAASGGVQVVWYGTDPSEMPQ